MRKRTLIGGIVHEISCQVSTVRQAVKTRYFWIGFAVLLLFLLLGATGMYWAARYDLNTAKTLFANLSCRASDAKIGGIIVGGFAFVLSCAFTLGEITLSMERRHKALVRKQAPPSCSPHAVISMLVTLALGIGGFFFMKYAC
jgi:hypothetical protein